MTRDDLITRLRALADGQHDDHSIGDEAADEIERLTKQRGDTMSEIQRYRVQHGDFGGISQEPDAAGPYVRWDDHHAEVERLRQEERQTAAREQELARDTIDRLAIERDEAQAEVERLKAAMSRCLLGDKPGDCYAAECVDLRAEVNRLITERNKAQSYVKWLIDERHSQASLDRSRHTDEDIWREAFLVGWQKYLTTEEAMNGAENVLTEYRKRWPR